MLLLLAGVAAQGSRSTDGPCRGVQRARLGLLLMMMMRDACMPVRVQLHQRRCKAGACWLLQHVLPCARCMWQHQPVGGGPWLRLLLRMQRGHWHEAGGASIVIVRGWWRRHGCCRAAGPTSPAAGALCWRRRRLLAGACEEAVRLSWLEAERWRQHAMVRQCARRWRRRLQLAARRRRRRGWLHRQLRWWRRLLRPAVTLPPDADATCAVLHVGALPARPAACARKLLLWHPAAHGSWMLAGAAAPATSAP